MLLSFKMRAPLLIYVTIYELGVYLNLLFTTNTTEVVNWKIDKTTGSVVSTHKQL